MRIAAVLVVGLTHTAFAQPVTRPSRCEVTIVRAPDNVRAAIETWIAAEPRCSTTLEVRVVVTENDQLYLVARDGGGRFYERVVPDAESAAALVASWVADDEVTSPQIDVNVNVDVHVGGDAPTPAPRPVAALELRAVGVPPRRAGWFVSGGPVFAGVAAGGELGIGAFLDPKLKLTVTGMAMTILPAPENTAYAVGLRLTRVGNAARWRFDYGVQASMISVTSPMTPVSGWTTGGHVGLGWELSPNVGLGIQLSAAVARVDGDFVPAGWASLILDHRL